VLAVVGHRFFVKSIAGADPSSGSHPLATFSRRGEGDFGGL